MKIQSLMCAVFLIFIILFSEKIFAQGSPDPGGDPMDSIVIKKPMVQVIPLQSPPTFSDRNNNEAVGIYGDDSQPKLNIVKQPTTYLFFCNNAVVALQQQQKITAVKTPKKGDQYLYFKQTIPINDVVLKFLIEK